ncbi:MAG TPA: hypothetical protein VHC96_07710 [Puia sp.]|jgi:hypothetical protein|nr:hypothetical protein [Puia sp.]
MILITTVIPLILLLGVSFFVTVLLHELGHAIPAIFMTTDDVNIYIGSLGDPDKCFHFFIGRIAVYCKYNPLLWYKGCCFAADTYYLSLDQRLLFTAGGPIASVIGTILTWLLLSVTENQDFLRVLTGGIFVVSLLATLGSLIPLVRVRYTASGQPVYNDGYEIFRILRAKFR